MHKVKKLGILGGMGARAGVQFLQKIINYSPAIKDQEFIEVILHNNSQIPDRTRAIVFNEESPLKELRRSIEMFDQQHVELIALACITSYYYYDQLIGCTKAKILNPIALVAELISTNYNTVKKVGLLATTGTVNSRIFHRELEKYDIETITLNPEDQENYFMKSVYMKNGLKSSKIAPEAKDLLLKAIPILEGCGVDLIVGACSEVQLVVNSQDLKSPFIDAIDVLAIEAVKECYNK